MTGLISYNKNSNIGVVARVNDSIALLPPLCPEEFSSAISRELEVEVFKTNIYGTSLIGSMTVMNNTGILLPKFVYKAEIEVIKKSRLNIGIIKDKLTALGNLVLSNDSGAIVCRKFTKSSIRTMGDVLDLEVEKGNIADFGIVGSMGVATNKGVIVHPLAKEDEIKRIESVLKTDVDVGTVNRGAGFVRTGILVNTKNVLLGDMTTGPEIMRIEDALGLL
ncbi:MAG: translation initiation factor IF-6 [Candidatus Hydrothermarchaeaceae archaeon]